MSQQKNVPRLRPALGEPAPDLDVLRCLVDDLPFAAAEQFAVQHTVPEDVFEIPDGQRPLGERGRDAVPLGTDRKAAQVQLVAGMDLRVTVQHVSQQRRPRPGHRQYEYRRRDEAIRDVHAAHRGAPARDGTPLNHAGSAAAFHAGGAVLAVPC
jgi:hypothetical protein